MKTFGKRRSALTAVMLLAGTGTIAAFHLLENRLANAAIASGLTLIAAILFLAAYNTRKKLTFLPVLSSSVWLQAHIYVALFAILVSIAHTGGRWPKGTLEIVVFGLFWAVSLSGAGGLALSRILPRRINQRGNQVIYEQIPQKRAELEEKARAIALASVESTGMSTIADFYSYKLSHFFLREHNRLEHFLGFSLRKIRLVSNINGVRRYLNAQELKVLAELEQLVGEKDTLDFQEAMQFTLKAWLFLHIPLTYSLIIFGSAHGLLAWAMSGS